MQIDHRSAKMTRIFATFVTIFVISFLLRSAECIRVVEHAVKRAIDRCEYSTPDAYLSTPQIIRRHGYTAEAHIIQTADGYLLEYHRIPHAKNVKAATRKYPILVHHGVLSAASDWIVAGPGKTLSYELADNGFDVWLANARGNTYSKSHVEYSPADKNFWNFSFHEIGFYDIPAAIDHILEVTSAKKVIYIGHSMGTTSFFVFASTRPEYKDKVLFSISLAPVGAIPHSSSLLATLAPYAKEIQKAANYLENGALLESDMLYCSFCKLFPNFCEEVLYSILGVDREQWNTSVLPLLAAKNPAGTSGKTAVHLSQLITTGFRYYDYGKDENVEKYQSETPPPYNISDSEIPMMFYYGRNDLISRPKDVVKLYHEISRPMGLTMIKYKKWNHADFLWAVENKKYFINPLMEFVINATTDDSFIKQLVKRALAERTAQRFEGSHIASNEQIHDKRSRSFTKQLHRTILKWLQQWLIKGLKVSTMRHANEENLEDEI